MLLFHLDLSLIVHFCNLIILISLLIDYEAVNLFIFLLRDFEIDDQILLTGVLLNHSFVRFKSLSQLVLLQSLLFSFLCLLFLLLLLLS